MASPGIASSTPARDRGGASRTPSPASRRSRTRDASRRGGRGTRGGRGDNDGNDDAASSYRTDKYDEDDDDWSSEVSRRRSPSQSPTLTPSPSPLPRRKATRPAPVAKRGPVAGKYGSPGRKPPGPRAGNGTKVSGVGGGVGGSRGSRSNKSSRTSLYTGGGGPPDQVSRRVHSARVHAAVSLRNEVSELQAKLDEATRENRALKQLQHRQEKALARFESQEGDLPQLLARHAGETRALREGLRRAREAERDAARRLRAAQDELAATRESLQRLQRLSEQRGLGEREELSRSLARAETRLDESERRVKDLEKNLELTTNSYQRQLAAERRKTQEAQAQVTALQEEIERLTQKLKDKERELDVKNIYASRLLKASPRKDTEATPRGTRPPKKGKPATVAVQTDDYFDTINFPPPPPPPQLSPPPHPKQQNPAAKDSDVGAARWDRERDDRTRREKEERDLENKARKLREEREREESERRLRERQAEEAAGAAEWARLGEERRRKDALLAKMREIDERMSATAATASPRRSPSPTLDDIARKPARPLLLRDDDTATDTATDTDASNSNGQGSHRGYKFSEPVRNLHNGVPAHAERDGGESRRRQRRGEGPTSAAADELAFGSYAPSFGRHSGRETLPLEQRRENSPKKGRPTPPGSRDKPGLIEQLFGTGEVAAVAAADGEAKTVPAPAAGKKAFPWDDDDEEEEEEAGDDARRKAGDRGGGAATTTAFRTHNGRHATTVTSTRPAVRAVDSPDDDVEELAL
ncbi:lebercilin-like [Lampetra fluviatilis]